MNTLVFRTAASLIRPMLLVISVIVLFKGHNEPGGGFVGGLLAAAAFALHVFENGTSRVSPSGKVHPRMLIATGLLLALVSGLPGLFLRGSFMTGIWDKLPLPALGMTDVGTPMLFDVGVYLAVLGVSLEVILVMAEDPQ